MRLFSDGTSVILSVLSTVLKYSAFPHSLKSSVYEEPVCEKRSHNSDYGSFSSKVLFSYCVFQTLSVFVPLLSSMAPA